MCLNSFSAVILKYCSSCVNILMCNAQKDFIKALSTIQHETCFFQVTSTWVEWKLLEQYLYPSKGISKLVQLFLSDYICCLNCKLYTVVRHVKKFYFDINFQISYIFMGSRCSPLVQPLWLGNRKGIWQQQLITFLLE